MVPARFFRGGEKVPDVTARIACFQEVLRANNAALGFIAEIQEALRPDHPLGAGDVRRMVTGVTVQTYRMIVNLGRMTGGRHSAILRRFNSIKADLARRVDVLPEHGPERPALAPSEGLVLPLSGVDLRMAGVVGQKSAYLGEAARVLGGHVPPGFATTLEAFRAFMEVDRLDARVAGELGRRDTGGLEEQGRGELGGQDTGEPGSWEDVGAVFAASARITQMIENAPLPDSLACALEAALASMPDGETPSALRLAVRSSALAEGGLEMSFAGQYRSLLNVPGDRIGEAFRSVVASAYSAPAMTYRSGRGFDPADVTMCCCVIRMVPSVAAGVLYTSYPTEKGEKTVLQAVRGLGLAAVDGSAEPDTYVLDRASLKIVSAHRGRQSTQLVCAPDAGTLKRRLPETGEMAVAPEMALAIADLGWRLESALSIPLDLEWAVDAAGEAFVLQVRPLVDVQRWGQRPRRPVLRNRSVLIERGSCASPGAAAGIVCRITTDLDLLRCPPGAVIVAAEANPRYAVLLKRAAAVVADMGEVTGHLATVARELRVPALFATQTATARLREGALVTVDAEAGVVYAGKVEEVLAPDAVATPQGSRNPHRELLESVAAGIVPLTLRDRLASGYSERKCRTLHDIIRFVHQTTIEAMFDLGDDALRSEGRLRKLISPVPIDCRLFDLGGGIRPEADPLVASIEDVLCRPMRLLWRGMTDPRLRWRQTRPVSLRGFMSAVVNYNFDGDARMRAMGEPSYAFIGSEYLNLNSRIGYHFATVDARIGPRRESNHVSFRFAGGSTGIEQRSRRAVLIEKLLKARGFETDCRADLVNARLRHRPEDEMDEALFHVGLLMGYVNHLDMALTSDSAARLYEENFLAGNYGFKGSEEEGVLPPDTNEKVPRPDAGGPDHRAEEGERT